MRALKRTKDELFRKVEFLPIVLTPHGDVVIRWNAHQEAISARKTTPLPIVFLADLYETVPMRTLRTVIAQDMRDIPAWQYWDEEDEWLR